MDYVRPETVCSPKGSVKNLEIIFDGGAGRWALAKLDWNGDPSFGVRWNGALPNVGTPQSRGIPTWFILPGELCEAALGATQAHMTEMSESMADEVGELKRILGQPTAGLDDYLKAAELLKSVVNDRGVEEAERQMLTFTGTPFDRNPERHEILKKMINSVTSGGIAGEDL